MNDDFLADLRAPSRPLPSNGDARAIERGRRMLHRRRMTYGAVGGAGALAIGGVAAYLTTSTDRSSLRVVTPATGGPRPLAADSPSPTATATLPPVTATPTLPSVTLPPTLPPSVGPTESVIPAPLGTDNPPPTPTESPTPEPEGPYVGPEPVGSDGLPIITRSQQNDPAFCGREAQVPGYNAMPGWCTGVSPSGQQDLVAGHRTSFSFSVCRPATSPSVTLHFDTDQEIGFNANEETDTDEAPRWASGDGYTYPSHPHSLTWAPGDCITWTGTWSGEADDGYAAPEGQYDMIAILGANEYAPTETSSAPPMASNPHLQLRWK